MKTFLYSLVTSAAVLGVVAPGGAVDYDLTTAGSSATINGAFFQQVPDQSTGTGVIEPFVRLQNNGTEEGYNTDLAPMPDVKTGLWTHDILVSAIPIVNLSGTDYYQVLLDINQTAANPLLSLYELEIYTAGSALTSADEYSDLTSGATLRYDLDAGTDNTILLNYSLNPGSGAGDMFAYIPVSALGGAAGSDYFYLYSAFGAPEASNDGFEEWAVISQTTPPPVPDAGTSMALLGIGLLGMAAVRRKLS